MRTRAAPAPGPAPTHQPPTNQQPNGQPPSTGQPSTGQPGTGQPPSTGQPSTGQPATGQPPSTDQPPAEPAVAAVAERNGAVATARFAPQRRHAPAFTPADLAGAVSIASLIALLGLPMGWLWSRLAPAQLSVVQADGSATALPTESQHRFDDVATFVLLGAVTGLLVGLGLWFLRRRRGPLALVGLVAGSLVAAWVASRTGLSFADGRYREAIEQATAGSVVPVAPRLDTGWVVLMVQPLLAVIAYGTAVAANGLEDLGRRLS